MVYVFSSERTDQTRGFLIRRAPLWCKEASRVHFDGSRKTKGEKRSTIPISGVLTESSICGWTCWGPLWVVWCHHSHTEAVSDNFSFLFISLSSRSLMCLCCSRSGSFLAGLDALVWGHHFHFVRGTTCFCPLTRFPLFGLCMIILWRCLLKVATWSYMWSSAVIQRQMAPFVYVSTCLCTLPATSKSLIHKPAE